MHFIFILLTIIPVLFHRPCYGSETEQRKRSTNMSFKEQMALLKLQYKILEKQMELKEKDYKIVIRKSKAERMDKFDAALKSLTQNVAFVDKKVKDNTRNIKQSRKWANTLSAKLKGHLHGLSTKLQANTNLLQVINRDRCQAGEFGVERFPKQPDWPATKNIKFKRPFSSSPSVVHGIIVLDSNGSRNLRGAATVSHVTNTGFTLRLSQWADTLLYSLKVRWMACR